MASSPDARSQPAGEGVRTASASIVETDAAKWRLELAALGGWLPGDGLRGGAGLGVGGGYGVFSFGGEIWRYRLSLTDRLSGETLRFSSTAVMPLVLGLAYQPGGGPLRLGVSGGAGFMYGPAVEVATCTTVGYSGPVYSLRGSLRWVQGSVALGPHIAWTRVAASELVGLCVMLSSGPDPNLKDYPSSLPMGLELGFGGVLGF